MRRDQQAVTLRYIVARFLGFGCHATTSPRYVFCALPANSPWTRCADLVRLAQVDHLGTGCQACCILFGWGCGGVAIAMENSRNSPWGYSSPRRIRTGTSMSQPERFQTWRPHHLGTSPRQSAPLGSQKYRSRLCRFLVTGIPVSDGRIYSPRRLLRLMISTTAAAVGFRPLRRGLHPLEVGTP